MFVNWMIEPDVFQGDIGPFLAALDRMGVPYLTTKFGKGYEEYVNAFGNDKCVVFYGSFQFSRICRDADWVPGIYCNLKQLDCQYYYPRFGQELANSAYMMLPFGDLDRQSKWLFDTYGDGEKLFVRPSSGFKTFTGQMVSRETWDKDFKLLGFYDVEPEELIVVAFPKVIDREWRTVVVDGKIVAATMYKENGEIVRVQGAPKEVLDYGQNLLDTIKYTPDRVWTLDLCQIQDSLKVMEVGSFSCAGLYACEPEPIIEAVNKVALEEWKEYYE